MDYLSILNVIKMILVLIFIIIFINILLRKLNKILLKQNKTIKIHEKVTVEANSSIAIVEVLGEYYLMSLTSNNSNILKNLNKKDVLEYIQSSKRNNSNINNSLKVREERE